MGDPATARRRVLLLDKFEGRTAAIVFFTSTNLTSDLGKKDCDRDVEEVGTGLGATPGGNSHES